MAFGRVQLGLFVRSLPEVQVMLDALSLLAEGQLREARAARMPFPGLYASGLRYQRESLGSEQWLTPLDAMRWNGRAWVPRGVALDCEDLSAWLAAELRQGGELGARAVCYAPRPGLVHCVVARGDGSREDVSKLLGMGGDG